MTTNDQALADLFQTAFTQSGGVGRTDAIICRRMKHNGIRLHFSTLELEALIFLLDHCDPPDYGKVARHVVEKIRAARRTLIFERARERDKQALNRPKTPIIAESRDLSKRNAEL